MNLTLITDQSCPTCGSRTVMESVRTLHTNGQAFEIREFLCGCRLAWSPNFSRLEVQQRCPKDPDEVALNQKRAAARQAVIDFLPTLDVDAEWRMKVLEGMPRA